ncbi:hypothetical protein SAY86_020559 [Trapa natans]|uniref:Cotton fiber protein n=1 Tax=Trapa natans TaxID=22666 RepID=A0AAN7LNK4_TRANT|nr:hypothetical protein SAY86_020559 [Trapa natans]
MSGVGGRCRAWSLLRLTLLWARKGCLFRRRLMMELSLVPKFLKKMGCVRNTRVDRIGFMGEREFSFDKTPVVHVKRHRPHSMRFLIPRFFPCVDHEIDLGYDSFGEGIGVGAYGCESISDTARKSFIGDGGRQLPESDDDDVEEEAMIDGLDGIDLRAEEFIAKFYEQMRLERQLSYLQYRQ